MSSLSFIDAGMSSGSRSMSRLAFGVEVAPRARLGVDAERPRHAVVASP